MNGPSGGRLAVPHDAAYWAGRAMRERRLAEGADGWRAALHLRDAERFERMAQRKRDLEGRG